MDGVMKRHWMALVILAGLMPLGVSAGPLIIEESAEVATPDPTFVGFGASFAVDGDYILATAFRNTDSSGQQVEHAAFLFRRQGDGSWRFERKLLQTPPGPCCTPGLTVGMNEGLAVIAVNDEIHFFERTGSTWSETLPPASGSLTFEVEVQGGTVLIRDSGGCGRLFRKNASGQWAQAGEVPATNRGCGDLDISGTNLIVANAADLATPSTRAEIWEGPIGAWNRTALDIPGSRADVAGTTGVGISKVALDNDTAIVGGRRTSGEYVFRREQGLWQLRARVTPPERLMMGSPLSLDHVAGKAYVSYSQDDLRGGSVCVFQRNANGSYTQVARLVGGEFEFIQGRIGAAKVSGRLVVASVNQALLVFELPTSFAQPALRQDDFEDGNAATWQPTPGSGFSVVSTSRTRVYRQGNPAGGSSFLNNTDWTNQAIQADVRPIALASGSWFGLVVRRVDANNFYYLRLGTNNTVQIRRRLAGTYLTLSSAPLQVLPNRHYRLRLEAVGTRLRAYIGSRPLLDARDTNLTRGQAGIAMSGVQADFDNVVVSPNHAITLLRDNFDLQRPVPIDPQSSPALAQNFWWTTTAGIWAIGVDGSKVFIQSSTHGDARAVTGVFTGDQIVQARVKPVAVAPGSDRWFGLMVRRRDDANYYYVTARTNNTILLRRLINDVPLTLDSAPFTFNLNTWYSLRLEAVGSLLRAYVNGVLLLEASDNTFAAGRYGAVMFRTAAHYDDFQATQP